MGETWINSSNVRKTVEVGEGRGMCDHKFHNSPLCDRGKEVRAA